MARYEDVFILKDKVSENLTKISKSFEFGSLLSLIFSNGLSLVPFFKRFLALVPLKNLITAFCKSVGLLSFETTEN